MANLTDEIILELQNGTYTWKCDYGISSILIRANGIKAAHVKFLKWWSFFPGGGREPTYLNITREYIRVFKRRKDKTKRICNGRPGHDGDREAETGDTPKEHGDRQT